MKLHVLVGQLEAHAGGELNPLQALTLKDWYYTKQPIFYTDETTGNLLWADTNDKKTYTLASIIHTVLDNTGEFI